VSAGIRDTPALEARSCTAADLPVAIIMPETAARVTSGAKIGRTPEGGRLGSSC
jgi:hypothetical protein